MNVIPPAMQPVATRFLGMTQTQIERILAEERGERWDLRFLRLADEVASWSKDPKHRVGAVLADPHNRVVGIGYNGFPDRYPDDPAMLASEAKHEGMVHAEMNAILNCPVPVRGCTLYSTHSPCRPCQPMIVQAGIIRAVWWEPDARWRAKHPVNAVLWDTIAIKAVPRPSEAVPGASFCL